MILRRLLVSLGALAAALPVMAVNAPTASADSYTCDSGEYCVWRSISYDWTDGIFTTAGKLASYQNYYFYDSGGLDSHKPIEENVSGYRNKGINSGPTIVYSYRDRNGSNA